MGQSPVQWGSEYRPFNSGNIWISNLLKFGFQMVWYSNGCSKALSYVLDNFYGTRLTIWIPDQYIRKQDGIHLTGIQMVGLSGIQMAFENRTIRHPASFRPLAHQTSSVFRSPRYSNSRFKSFIDFVRPQVTDTEMENILSQIVDGLFSVCVTLGTVPIIRWNISSFQFPRGLEYQTRSAFQ